MKSGLVLNQAGWVGANARMLAGFAQQAYAAAVAPAPAQGVWDSRTNTRAIVTAFEDCQVIAFRGTASLRDWLTDADFPLRPMAGMAGKVHAGFGRAIMAVIEEVKHVLGPPGVNARPVVVTGHSLGGALAVLAARLLFAAGYEIHSVYTFGQPRTGDKVFAAEYGSVLGDRTFRVVNQNDIVPRVPGVLLGYRHHGHLAFVTIAGGLVLDPSWLTLLVTDALGLWAAYRQRRDVLVEDHFMNHYGPALQNL